MDASSKFADLLSGLNPPPGNDVSGATTPGADWRDANGPGGGEDDRDSPRRPRTFPYWTYLPYKVEVDRERQSNLDEILLRLYIAVEAGDFAPGAVHWTRELRSWLGLKYEMSRSLRVNLARFYYGLALAPGIDPGVGDRFASMFMVITK